MKEKILILIIGLLFIVIGIIAILNGELFKWTGSPNSKNGGPPILYLLFGLIIVFFTLKNWKKI